MTAKAKALPEPAKRVGKSIDEWKRTYDKGFIIPQRIREGLKKLGSGWEYEVDFIRICGISATDLANYRDQFEEHFVIVGGRNSKRAWSGNPETAKKMREMAG